MKYQLTPPKSKSGYEYSSNGSIHSRFNSCLFFHKNHGMRCLFLRLVGGFPLAQPIVSPLSGIGRREENPHQKDSHQSHSTLAIDQINSFVKLRRMRTGDSRTVIRVTTNSLAAKQTTIPHQFHCQIKS